MSSTFEVTSQVSQIMLGDQDVVTLVNDGPFTVYFDDNPSVSEINGFELPPTGQMTWKANKKLFAKCRTIRSGDIGSSVDPLVRAKVRTAIPGELSLTTRAKFFRQLQTGVGIVDSSGKPPLFVETGHCNTLLVTTSISDSQVGVVIGFNPTYTVTWFDEDLQKITAETWFFWLAYSGNGSQLPIGALTPTVRMQIPVKGKYVQISPNFSASTMQIRIAGTDAVLLAKNDAGPAIQAGLGAPGIFTYYGTHLIANNVIPTTQLLLPMIGSKINFEFSNPGAAGFVVVQSWLSLNRLALAAIAAGNDSSVSFDLPPNEYHLISFAGAGLTSQCTVFWPNASLVN